MIKYYQGRQHINLRPCFLRAPPVSGSLLSGTPGTPWTSRSRRRSQTSRPPTELSRWTQTRWRWSGWTPDIVLLLTGYRFITWIPRWSRSWSRSPHSWWTLSRISGLPSSMSSKLSSTPCCNSSDKPHDDQESSSLACWLRRRPRWPGGPWCWCSWTAAESGTARRTRRGWWQCQSGTWTQLCCHRSLAQINTLKHRQ